jgi:GTPase
VEHVVRGDERVDGDALRGMMRVHRVSRAEVDRVEPARREVRDVRPRLLGLDLEPACCTKRSYGRGVGDHARRWCVADDVEACPLGNELGEELFGLERVAVRRVAEVERRRGLARDDVVRDPRFETCDGHDLAELQPIDDRHSRRAVEERRKSAHGVFERTVREPRPCGVPARPVEPQARDDVPEAACVNLEVGGLEDDRKRRLVHGTRPGEERGEGVVLGRELLAPEQEQRQVARRRTLLEVACELDRDGEAALHVAGPEAVHRIVFDSPRKVALRRHRVVVGGEDDEWCAGTPRPDEEKRLVALVLGLPARRYEGQQTLADRPLAAALGRDVDELEGPGGKAVGEPGHGASVPRHNLAVTARQPDPAPGAAPERGLLVGVYPKGSDGELELGELRELAHTAGVSPVAELVQHRAHPDPRSFVGKGKLAELKQAYSNEAAEVLLADDELSPTQQRALEDALGARVVDRTQLILDIFAQHARSAEGKLQVELAQLEYNLPRMRGMWKHLERLGGGVGTRGPGESQLETDRRLARTRVSLLKRRLHALEGQRSTRRKERVRSSAPTIALAGYTNVGKSTLLNALTGAHASVDDRLFETLDPTTRAFEHDGKRYLVTDTVGFIRRLPTELVEGFAATLEETLVADLVLHVADASLPENRLAETIAAVTSVLTAIGADDIPVELVLNKADCLDPLARRRIEHTYPRAQLISAASGEGLEALKTRIAGLFSDRFEDVRLLVPYSDGRTLAALYDLGAPIAERRDTPEGVRVRARLPRSEAARFARYLVAGEHGLDEASAR